MADIENEINQEETRVEFDASNPKDVKKRKTRAELDRDREVQELRRVLETPGGRYFCWRLMAEAGTFKMSFHPGRDGWTEFNEGKRNIGNWVLNEVLTSHKDAFILMRDEAQERENGKD